MNDNSKAVLAAALAGGYLLGRTRKAKLALAVGSYLAGRRYGLSLHSLTPRGLLDEGLTRLRETPQYAALSEQVRQELLTAGRTAVSAAADRHLTSLADLLRERTSALTGVSVGPKGETPDEEEKEKDGPEEATDENDAGPEDGEGGEENGAGDSGEDGPAPGSHRPGRRPVTPPGDIAKTSSHRAPTKKAPGGRVNPAEKTAAAKRASDDGTAKRKAPARKAAPAKEAAPAKKAARKSTPRGAAGTGRSAAPSRRAK
ncbi:hypothetical protein [Streptomyces sp. NPDC007088]|uniref:hypothetical protein n=1 Tax=Streptomyces sp. NPDC007088 TaxID=3364773 RepID=UPI0036C4F32D